MAEKIRDEVEPTAPKIDVETELATSKAEIAGQGRRIAELMKQLDQVRPADEAMVQTHLQLKAREDAVRRRESALERVATGDLPVAVGLALVGESDDQTKANFDAVETYLTERDEKLTNKLLLKDARTPQAGGTVKPLTMAMIDRMTKADVAALPPAVFEAMLSQAQGGE